MTSIQTFRTSPAKVNELFAALIESRSGAAKTRNRLFTELKTELELLGRLEEEHLVPALNRHAATMDLAAAAKAGVRETRAMLKALDGMAKDGGEFPAKVVELRTLFQQHLRDEKNELLPVVQKALSDEEAVALARDITAHASDVEDAVREGADQRGAAGGRKLEAATEREQTTADASQQPTREAAHPAERTAAASADGAKARVAGLGTIVEPALGAVADVSKRSADRFSKAVHSAQEISRNVALAAQCGTVLAEGMQGASRECMSWAKSYLETQAKGYGALLQCKSAQDFIAVQTRMTRESLELMFASTSRLAAITRTATEAAAQRISSPS